MDLKTISKPNLNAILRQFYAEVKTVDKKPLAPNTLAGIQAAIHRHLISDLQRNVQICTEPDFNTANEMFDSKIKLYRINHNAKPKHHAAI